MVIYGLKNCDTCRKAAKALGVGVTDLRESGMPEAVRARALDEFGAALVNRRSTTWRGLSEAERGDAPLALLQKYPALMKRPLIEAGGRLYLGWDEAVQEALHG
ncbi:ArsC/Spx/MgsR family protein [Aquicoccus sp. G2-2]|uniref:ArsC/Spx/MgsR family protein n=1 Tax=Aquicoccus sp. G2-2 TaxID=3092120 RepID=UPI002AE07F7C|nr:ArsC/Spx/MgsR family protein [Aquicoccus sp. G2-2]MEA1112697.1 ArsC/Spx/MgsR family protein [Aquicoccus sp. G2-2]